MNEEIRKKIFKTTEYDKFKILNFNRDLREKHVLNIMESLKSVNLLHKFPISVKEDMSVMDGQHRLEAAKRLGVPIYYEINEDLKDEDIIIINNTQRWKLEDYSKYYSEKGNKAYILYQDMCKHYSLRTYLINSLLDGDSSYISKIKRFKSGQLKLEQLESLKEFLDKFLKIKEILKKHLISNYSFINNKEFVICLKIFLQEEEFDYSIFIDKLNKYGYMVKQRSTINEYKKIFLYIYNYKSRKPIKLAGVEEFYE